MITLQMAYWLFGVFMAWVAVRGWRDTGNPRRGSTGAFWALLALVFLAGDRLPAAVVGAIVVALALIAGVGGVKLGRYPERSAQQRKADATRLGTKLLVPALAIPTLTLLLAVPLKDVQFAGRTLLDTQQTTLVALAVACTVAVAAACLMLRETPAMAVEQSRRLLDSIGWAAVLPMLLAVLGSLFAAAGVGEAVAGVVREVIPVDQRLAVVVAYALGMAVFTMIMGNAFAAFPVMTAGIALPLLVQLHGADAAPLAAVGMLSGYCGTLLTPMAANFNLVPAALLELQDPNAVIKAQVGTALPLLACNIVLMYLLIFR